MRIIEYRRNGEAIGDFDCEERAKFFLKEASAGNGRMNVSTSTFITIVRALICEGYADHRDVIFLFEGRYLAVDKDGRMNDWPNGFCDAELNALSRLMQGRKK